MKSIYIKTLLISFILFLIFGCNDQNDELSSCLCTKNTIVVKENVIVLEDQEVLLDQCRRNGETEIIDMGNQNDYKKISWVCM